MGDRTLDLSYYGKKMKEGVQEQGTQENILTQGEGSNKRLEKSHEERFYTGFEFPTAVTIKDTTF
jgi:hypothetical protein